MNDFIVVAISKIVVNVVFFLLLLVVIDKREKLY